MTKEEAFMQFSAWYQECLDGGIEPEEIVAQMGGMALITDPDLVDQLSEAQSVS